jgi:plastocyanin
MTFVVNAMERADYDAYLAERVAADETQEPAAGECEVTVDVGAENVAFDIDEFEVPADTAFCINFENREDIPHNVAIYDGEEALFTGDVLNEAGSITYQVPALPAGEYRFICDVHPEAMVGDVIVTSQ